MISTCMGTSVASSCVADAVRVDKVTSTFYQAVYMYCLTQSVSIKYTRGNTILIKRCYLSILLGR